MGIKRVEKGVLVAYLVCMHTHRYLPAVNWLPGAPFQSLSATMSFPSRYERSRAEKGREEKQRGWNTGQRFRVEDLCRMTRWSVVL
jgi:hypothetical protein